MLQEHVEIVKALDELEKAAGRPKKHALIRFTRKLTAHVRTVEDLTYLTVLLIGNCLLNRGYPAVHAPPLLEAQ